MTRDNTTVYFGQADMEPLIESALQTKRFVKQKVNGTFTNQLETPIRGTKGPKGGELRMDIFIQIGPKKHPMEVKLLSCEILHYSNEKAQILRYIAGLQNSVHNQGRLYVLHVHEHFKIEG